jgi:signal transduction histidine kinase
MLSRLGVRQKLSMLLVLPFTAVVFTVVPITVGLADQARAASMTAQAARQARQVGELIRQLQQERLLSVAYLTLPSLDRSALLTQQRTVADDAAQVRGAGGVGAALTRLAALDPVRTGVLRHAVEPAAVYAEYQAVIEALLDGTGLLGRSDVDAVGLRQLEAIDALLRANEQASSVGAALVVAAAQPVPGAPLLSSAQTGLRLETLRFHALATPGQVAQVDGVEKGPASRRIAGLAGQPSPSGPPTPVAVALSAAQSYAALRQFVEDSIAVNAARDADQRAAHSQVLAGSAGAVAVLVLVLVVILGTRVSGSIAAPLRRLTRAAGAVADLTGNELIRVADSDEDEQAPPRLAAVNVHGRDEVGELAAAFNRVQATAALLLERQVVTRRNVSVMFATIARRTQGLVARQLSVIDEMERDEQDSVRLDRLYRLDHLSTRLRRSADSLLVVSGVQHNLVAAPLPLVDAIRAAMAEVEGFRGIRLGAVSDVVVSVEFADDLRLLLAELLENATVASPPDTVVEVGAVLGATCRVFVVDHGIGMPSARLAEENQRLRERQRLDLAPTSVLGLFVVGRLARRHGLTVELSPTPGHGVTVTVEIPPRLYAPATVPAAVEAAVVEPGPVPPTVAPTRPGPPPTPMSALPAAPVSAAARNTGNGGPAAGRATVGPPSIPAAADSPRFSWFPTRLAPPATPAWNAPTAPEHGIPVPAPGVALPPAEPWNRQTESGSEPNRRGGLNRRVPGQHAAALVGGGEPPRRPAMRDALAERAQMEGFADADRLVAQGPIAPDGPEPARRGGLTRRTPGAHISDAARPGTRPAGAGTRAAAPATGPAAQPVRDAAAEREQMAGFLDGFARGVHGPDHD